MQILFDSDTLSMQRYGGASRYPVELMMELKALGVSIDLVSAPRNNAYLEQSGLFPGKASALPAALRWSISVVNSAFGRGDLIHRSYFGPFRPRGMKEVVTVYDCIAEHLGLPYLHSKVEHVLKRRALKRADQIIAISEFTKNDVIHFFGVSPDRIRVIPLGSRFDIGEPLPRSSTLLMVGQRGGYKQGLEALQALKGLELLRDWDLRVVGGGDLSHEEKLAVEAAGFRSWKQETLQDAALEQAYRESALLLYPSRLEGFGLPLLEAMRCGCPVLCSHAGSLPEVGGGAVAYADPRESDAYRAACSALLDSETERQRLQELGFQQAQRFSWRRCAEESLALYQELLG